ncbi:hypothetical protein ACWDLL_14085 [Streptomyces griseoincarnatus]|mgnify:CR=1 FL=1|nr:hypothetical protein [Streptomyces sp. 2BBP-J2]NIL50518.1 hypothetical protein [Streptomyces sp. 2BBP-J2]WSB54364.1 hypothetical protein OG880_11340 [Streptomyces cellulosae]WTB69388.1 hypothetical protein OIE90_11350 [Streptomyces cellulosae]
MDDSLSFDSLFRGARKFARSALEAHGAEDEEVFLLHAGVSVERLAKAALVKKSPFLLMEMKGKDDTLYHLTGVRQASKLRTVGASQAIARLRDMAVLAQKDPDLDELIELRNGVAHLMASVDDGFDGLTVFCRVTNQLLDHLTQDQGLYWGSWSTLVGITLSDAHERVERDVARRIEHARRLLKKRFEDLPQEALDSYVATRPHLTYGIQISKNNPLTVFVPWSCPACDHPGVITAGAPFLVRRGQPGKSIADSFLCFVCQFTLKAHEIEAAGIPRAVPLVDQAGERLLTDVDEFLWHFDPDGNGIVEDD